MSQLSLLVALAGLALAPAPQDPAPAPAPEPAQAGKGEGKRGYGGIVGTQDPRWMGRSEMRKILFENGGKSLMDAWQGAWIWLSAQTPEQDALMPTEDGRGVGLSSICALSMSGNGSGIRAGAQRTQYRVLTRALRALQDPGSGAYVAEDAPERALDQALAVHCMAEATISNPVDELFAHNQKGVGALLALRGADRLWHAPAKESAETAPVDAFATGVAAYALYTAEDAGAQVEDEAFEAILEWSATAALDGADDGARAANTVGVLCARIFAAAGLERNLAEDARVAELLTALDAFLPRPAADGAPAAAGQAERNDFTYLATVALYQADTTRWNRLYGWIRERVVADVPVEATDPDKPAKPAENRGFPAGKNGRLPAGAVGTTALRILQMQSVVREPALKVFASE